MNILLIFFALPIATVILAIVLQKILKNPILVAATFFAIYLIVAFAIFDASFLICVIAYTVLAYIAAVITKWICRLAKMIENQNNSCRVVERPITINTSPCNSIRLTENSTLIPTNTCACRRMNGSCSCGGRCGHK